MTVIKNACFGTKIIIVLNLKTDQMFWAFQLYGKNAENQKEKNRIVLSGVFEVL